MSDIRKTHKGNAIDIDLIKMKQELELKEVNTVNIKREKEIDVKRRRGSSNKINEMLANQEAVRQKLRQQKDDTKSETSVETAQSNEAEKPETTGRKIIKK